MVTFYKPVKKAVEKKAVKVTCTDLDLQGRGVARTDKYVYFVEGLMPGDTANVLADLVKGKVAEATITKIITPSKDRLEKDCPLIGQCGGCPLEHIPAEQLVDAKVAGIRRLFTKTFGEELSEPSFIHKSSDKNYRRACRFAIRGDHGKLYLGFRQEKSHNLVKVSNCLTLTKRMNDAIKPLNKVINQMEQKGEIGHIELLDSDGLLGILIRITKTLKERDTNLLQEVGKDLNAVISVVEPYKDPMAITKQETTRERIIFGSIDELFIVSHGVKIKCKPSSFVQVNSSVNEKMLDTVLEMVEPSADSRIMDLFCGLGNFAMPIAKSGAKVVGVDIVSKMIEDARNNAKEQGLDNARFEVADLEELFENQSWAKAEYDAVVMDPGRQGAKRASLFLIKKQVKKVVLISCNPLAASRDCQEFIKAGYKINRWGVCDMFPRTSHIEMVILMTKA
ncbi:MAG: 23S rRNA (uracil(1939)-C(5))-methyltransferase RlmD [Aeromonadales bacterium]|nr:23S rRNA (uracil(1939)-C(5))-methyltransferase RlmD [Aeromonadales bacterium]